MDRARCSLAMCCLSFRAIESRFKRKLAPPHLSSEFTERFNTSLNYLKLDYVDLLAFHGVNTLELLDMVLRPGGCLEAVRGLQREGRVRFVGFSTHGPTSVIVKTVETGEFDYMNLHWYWVNNLNRPAIDAAAKRDMGVFIISPTDKGGMLQAPPEKLVKLCAPLAPMQFNDLYCLARPEVHTLSVGAARPTDFDAHVDALKHYHEIDNVITPIRSRLIDEMVKCVGRDWAQSWWTALPECTEMPGEVNVQEILRLWTYVKGFDLTEWAKSRYNLLGNADHWQPGNNAGDIDEPALAAALGNSPFVDKIPRGLARGTRDICCTTLPVNGRARGKQCKSVNRTNVLALCGDAPYHISYMASSVTSNSLCGCWPAANSCRRSENPVRENITSIGPSAAPIVSTCRLNSAADALRSASSAAYSATSTREFVHLQDPVNTVLLSESTATTSISRSWAPHHVPISTKRRSSGSFPASNARHRY